MNMLISSPTATSDVNILISWACVERENVREDGGEVGLKRDNCLSRELSERPSEVVLPILPV